MPLTDILLMFLPRELLPLIVLGAGLAFICGVMKRGRALAIVVMVLSMPVIDRVFEVLLDELPGWLVFLVSIILGLQVLRTLLTWIVGREAAGHVLGALVLGVFRVALRLAFMPLRLAGGVTAAAIRVVAARAF